VIEDPVEYLALRDNTIPFDVRGGVMTSQ